MRPLAPLPQERNRAGEGRGGTLFLFRRTISPAPVAESRIGSSNADRFGGSGGGEPDWVLLCGPVRRLRWRRAELGPPMRTVSAAPVAESRIGSSYADRFAGSGGGDRDRVSFLVRQPARPALSHPGSRGGPSPPPSSMLCALLAARRHRGPAAEASAALAAVCRTLRAIQRRPWPPTLAARQLRGLSSRSAGLGALGALRELLLGLVEDGGAEQRRLAGCAPSGTGTGTFTGTGLWRRGEPLLLAS
jgi:hypothetical protein